MGNELNQMDINTAADLRQISQARLTQKFGDRIGTFLWLACRGQVSSATLTIVTTTFSGISAKCVAVSALGVRGTLHSSATLYSSQF